MLTFEKTWQHAWNYSPVTSSAVNQEKNIAWWFKAFLKGEITTYYNGAGTAVSPSGLWTCVSSCDGSGGGGSFGNSDNNDRWTNTFSSSLIVQAIDGSNHSWIVLKSPVAVSPTVYWIIDMNNATGNKFTLVMSHVLPAGGTATARPTASDEIVMAAPNFCNATTTQRCHGSLSTDGIFSLFVTDTAGVMATAWLFQVMAEARTGDNYPFVGYFKSASTCLTETQIGTTSNWFARNADGSLMGQVSPALTPQHLHLNGVSTAIFNSASNCMSLHDYGDGLFDDLPIYMYAQVAGWQAIKGRLYDIRWAPQSLNVGYPEPTAANPLSVVMGHVWVPTYVIPWT